MSVWMSVWYELFLMAAVAVGFTVIAAVVIMLGLCAYAATCWLQRKLGL